jgi:prolipoprotein diacylglyceryltransferase
LKHGKAFAKQLVLVEDNGIHSKTVSEYKQDSITLFSNPVIHLGGVTSPSVEVETMLLIRLLYHLRDGRRPPTPPTFWAFVYAVFELTAIAYLIVSAFRDEGSVGGAFMSLFWLAYLCIRFSLEESHEPWLKNG